jgi:hypothetical protein
MGNKLQVEQMRQTPGIAGYAYCIFMDAYDWTCGLVDPYLSTKSHAAAFARHNQADIVLWPHDRWCFWRGETFTVTPAVSLYGDYHPPLGPLRQASLLWRLYDAETVLAEGALEGLEIAPYRVSDLPPFEVRIPNAGPSHKLRLDLSLDGASSTLRNSWDIWAFERPAIDARGALVGVLDVGFNPRDPQQTCAALLAAFPTLVPVSSEQLARAGVLVTTGLTEAVVRYLEGGGRVLWLQDGQDYDCRFYDGGPIVDYHATLIPEHPALAAFPHEGWCDLQFHNLIGDAVVDTGYFPSQKLAPLIEAFHVPFLIDHPTVLPFRRKGFLVETRVGAGLLLATTFLIAEAGKLPEAQALFGSLLTYLLAPPSEPAYALDADELREWAWGSVHGAVPLDFVEFSFS